MSVYGREKGEIERKRWREESKGAGPHVSHFLTNSRIIQITSPSVCKKGGRSKWVGGQEAKNVVAFSITWNSELMGKYFPTVQFLGIIK